MVSVVAERVLPVLTDQPAGVVELRGDLWLAWRMSDQREPMPPTFDRLVAALVELEADGRARYSPGEGWSMVTAAERAA